jgi:hypothetical protein
MSTDKITRAEFLQIAGIPERDLDKLRDCGLIQQFKCHPSQRKGRYWKCQAEAVRDGRPIPMVAWVNPKSGR